MFLRNAFINRETSNAIFELSVAVMAQIKKCSFAEVRREHDHLLKPIYDRISFAIIGDDIGISKEAINQLKKALKDI